MTRFLLTVMALGLASCSPIKDRLQDRYFPGSREEVKLPDPLPPRDGIPVFAVLDGDAVQVEMDDGFVCLGSAGDNLRSNGWTGNLTECPYEYSYSVQLALGTSSDRVVLQPVESSGVTQEEIVFRPVASLVVVDFIGREYRFEAGDGF